MATRGRGRRGRKPKPQATGSPQESQTEVGCEQPDGQARIADKRGYDAGGARIPRERATGPDSPAKQEIRAIGGVRSALLRGAAALRRVGPQSRIDGANHRVEEAEADHRHFRWRLSHLLATVLPLRQDGVVAVRGSLAELKQRYADLSLVERGIPFLVLAVVESIAIGVGLFDALALAHPLEAAGIASGWMLRGLISTVAVGVFVAVNVAGLGGGMLGLGLPTRDRRKLLLASLASIVGLLMLGFLLVGVLRHLWTGDVNEALQRAAEGHATVPPRLDSAFLVPLQAAAALAGSLVMAIYVMGDAGRTLRAAIAQEEEKLAAHEGALQRTLQSIETGVPDALRAAAKAPHGVRADAAAGKAELRGIDAEETADQAAEAALTKAAEHRHDAVFDHQDKLHDNGRSADTRHPDGLVKRSLRSRVVDEAPKPPRVPAPGPNGHGPNGNGRNGHDRQALSQQQLAELINGPDEERT